MNLSGYVKKETEYPWGQLIHFEICYFVLWEREDFPYSGNIGILFGVSIWGNIFSNRLK